VIPPSCTVLTAKLPATLSDADEIEPDTLRIQDALDHCAWSHGLGPAHTGIDVSDANTLTARLTALSSSDCPVVMAIDPSVGGQFRNTAAAHRIGRVPAEGEDC
jgi:hypothetical protein